MILTGVRYNFAGFFLMAQAVEGKRKKYLRLALTLLNVEGFYEFSYPASTVHISLMVAYKDNIAEVEGIRAEL
jgi:hypothetical protein